MGLVFSCFHARDPEEDVVASNRNRINCFVSNLFNQNARIFRSGETNVLPPPTQEAASSTSNGAPENTEADRNLSSLPPGPLYRCSDLRQDGLFTGLERGTVFPQIDSEPRSGTVHIDQDLATESEKGLISDSKSSTITLKAGSESPMISSGAEYLCRYPSSETEYVCPTCLEEYTPENPRIITHCFHHFHLGCIYEWKERSETCPVCCRVLTFDEAN